MQKYMILENLEMYLNMDENEKNKLQGPLY